MDLLKYIHVRPRSEAQIYPDTLMRWDLKHGGERNICVHTFPYMPTSHLMNLILIMFHKLYNCRFLFVYPIPTLARPDQPTKAKALIPTKK